MSSFALTTSSIRLLAVAAAVVLALGIGHDLLHMPLQIGDSLAPLLDAVRASVAVVGVPRRTSPRAATSGRCGSRRSRSSRIWRTANTCSPTGCFTHCSSWHFSFCSCGPSRCAIALTLAVVPLALTVFVGIHTFLGTVKEIYPTNHFLQIAVLALLALNLAQSKGGVLVDLPARHFRCRGADARVGTARAGWSSSPPGCPGCRGCRGATVAGVTALARAATSCCGSGSSAPVCRRSRSEAPGFLLEALEPTPDSRALRRQPVAALRLQRRLVHLVGAVFGAAVGRLGLRSRDSRRPAGAAAFHPDRGVALRDRAAARLRGRARPRGRQAARHAGGPAHGDLRAGARGERGDVVRLHEGRDHEHGRRLLRAAGVRAPRCTSFGRGPCAPRTWQATAAVCVVCLAGSAAWAIRAAGVHHVLRSQAFVQRNDWTRLDREWSRDGNWERYRAQEPLVRAAAARSHRDARGQSALRAALDGTCLRHLLLTDRPT